MLGDERKRRIYDEYGPMGLKLAEQVGEDVRIIMRLCMLLL